jgi:hypothetical protein
MQAAKEIASKPPDGHLRAPNKRCTMRVTTAQMMRSNKWVGCKVAFGAMRHVKEAIDAFQAKRTGQLC